MSKRVKLSMFFLLVLFFKVVWMPTVIFQCFLIALYAGYLIAQDLWDCLKHSVLALTREPSWTADHAITRWRPNTLKEFFSWAWQSRDFTYSRTETYFPKVVDKQPL